MDTYTGKHSNVTEEGSVTTNQGQIDTNMGTVENNTSVRDETSKTGFNVNRKRRVAGYARVSTDSEEQSTSYEAQVDYYTNYIKSNPDWAFVDVYTDEGISGVMTKNRDGFNRMVADALAGKIEIKTAELIQFDFSNAATF